MLTRYTARGIAVTHAIEPNDHDDFRRTRLVWGWIMLVADAISLVVHGPSPVHVAIMFGASGLLFPHRWPELLRSVAEVIRAKGRHP
jgi:hypothetical protein